MKARAGLWFAVAACGGGGGDSAVDAGGVDAPSLQCGEPLAISPIAAGEPLYGDGRCPGAPRAAYPAVGCRLDLRDHRPGDLGTCSADLAAGSRGRLLGEPLRVHVDRLPIVIDLPEGRTDDACPTLCAQEPGETITRFGLRIAIEDVRTFLSIRVEPPWAFVTGNETEPTLCHDGYPTVLELGGPVACAFTYADEIDVVTSDPAPPPARLLIATDDTSNEWSNCCLFPTP